MKYWVYINGQVPGCYSAGDLAALPGFGLTTLVCPAEGEILEKNWKRAGEFQDLSFAVEDKDRKSPPKPPLEAPPASAVDVDKLIDTASHRLFSHVADLMKELENRREEKALTQSLQRQIGALKDELQAERERRNVLETRIPRIAELEEARRRDVELVSKLESSLKAREEAMNAIRHDLELIRTELETTKRRLGETANDLAIRNRLVDKLSKDLTEKEVSLAKSLSVIRRLEEDLNRVCPGATQAEAVAPPAPVFSPVPSEPPPAPEEPKAAPEIPVLAKPVVPVVETAPVESAPSAPAPKQEELAVPAAPEPEPPLPSADAAKAETPTPRGLRPWLRKMDPTRAPTPTPTPLPKQAFTTDEPPKAPDIIEPPDPEKLGAQTALMDFFRRFMKKDKPEA